MLAAATLLALMGPFGSWVIPIGRRLLDWALFAAGGYLFFSPVVWAALALSEHTRLPRRPALALAGLLASLPTTLLVAWALTGMAVTRWTVAELATLYPEVAFVGLLVTAAQIAMRQSWEPARAPGFARESGELAECASPQVEIESTPSRFLDRLPPTLGTDLLALEQEDHYLRAYTALGNTLLLMRMRDAVAELEMVDGARVHRSWWVARGAVAEVLRRDRAVALRLRNQIEVPVARSAAPPLRESGWW